MSSVDPSLDRRFFGHPRGLATLFFTEFWERWSFYGMRALLVLFMTTAVAASADGPGGGLGFSESHATSLYHIYGSLIYLMSLPGGWLADRFLGPRKSVLYGGIVIMCGHVVLAIHGATTFFLGLGLVILGTGLLKPNVSTIVGQLYTPADQRRDSAYSIFYMGINLGSFVSQIVCPKLAENPNVRIWLEQVGIDPARSWQLGFGAAAVGMFCGIVQYVRSSKILGEAGLRAATAHDPVQRKKDVRTLSVTVGAVVAAAIVVTILVSTGAVTLSVELIDSWFGRFLTLLTVGFFAWLFLSGQWSAIERKRLIVIFILFCASTVFWAGYEQAGSTLTIFARDDTHRTLLGYGIEAGEYQSVNPLMVIVFSPVLAWVWLRLGPRDLSSPVKCGLGLLFVGLGYVLMLGGAALAEGDARVSPLWLIGLYTFHAIGEVCLSPVGLSVMSKLAPLRVVSLMMGVWFLSISVGFYLGGQIAHHFEGFSRYELFSALGTMTIVPGVLLMCAAPWINSLTKERDATR
jgi:POT family proton-dependent oligopeptide transporter